MALLAAFLMAIEPHQILFCHFLFADTLFATLFLLTFYFYVKGLQEKQTHYFALCAVFMGLNLLTKPVIPVLSVCVVLVFADMDKAFLAASNKKCIDGFTIILCICVAVDVPKLHKV